MDAAKPARIYQDTLPPSLKFKRLLWHMTVLLCFRPTPRGFLHRWRVFLLRAFGAKIGHGCKVDPSCHVWAPWNLTLGDLTALAQGTDIYCVSPVTIGSNVAVSQRSFLCTASHDIRSLARPLIHRPITIEDHAWVCAEAFVGPGVTVGEGAVVGARAMVVKDVGAWEVVSGNPAQVLKKRELQG